MKRKKKTKRQLLKVKLDKAWGLRIRQAKYCAWCDKDGKEKIGQHAHHIVNRRFMRTRYLKENGVCLCYPCHIFRIRREPVEYTDFLYWYLGDGDTGLGRVEYLTLKKRSQEIWKPTLQGLENLLKELGGKDD